MPCYGGVYESEAEEVNTEPGNIEDDEWCSDRQVWEHVSIALYYCFLYMQNLS